MADKITRRELNRALLSRQFLLARNGTSPAPVIERLFGMQAQQAAPPFIGLWTRISRFGKQDLRALIQSREVVRVTAMRATLHLMTAADYIRYRSTLQPMLSKAASAILRGRKADVSDPEVLRKAQAAFSAGPHTFAELRTELSDSFPDLDERAMGYLARMHLPLVTVPDDVEWAYRTTSCFTVASAWLGRDVDSESRPEDLVLRYLKAFGPATAADAQAWSGMGGLKEVFASLRPKLRVFQDESGRELFDLETAHRPAPDEPAPVCFLPAFDNVILGHADRTRIVPEEHRARLTTKNLIVPATFLVDGFVAGAWQFERDRKGLRITLAPFIALSKKVRQEATARAHELGSFLGDEKISADVEWTA